MSNVLEKRSPDIPTVIAISIFSWSLFAVLHEVVGHGVSAILLGEKLLGAVTTTVHIDDFYDLDHVASRIGWWGFRTVAATGSLVNFITGALAIILLRSERITSPTTRYFLWLFATISIVQQAFWLAVMPFAGLGGDWTAFFVELEPAVLWKAGVTAIGIFLLWAGYQLPIRQWMPAIRGDRNERWAQIRRLTIVPILAAFIFQMLSILWSPLEGPRHTTIVSVFSFIPLFLWLIPANLVRWPEAPSSSEIFHLNRSKVWLVIGLIALVLFVFVLGPGIGSFTGHPSYGG
jgi:hypothetical protein